MTRWGIPGLVLAALALASQPGPAQSPPPRRFVIDSHLHYRSEPDFFVRLRLLFAGELFYEGTIWPEVPTRSGPLRWA
jgi:hypothetical protein